jgi:methylase of polypeptide subunit release factors
VLTTRSALALIAGLTRPTGAPPLLQALGFAGATRLDAATARALGIEAFASGGIVVRRTGTLRAIGLVAHAHDVRAVLERCTTQLAARAPEYRWVLVVLASAGHAAALSTFHDRDGRPRRATLLLDPRHPRESDGETLAALAAAAAGDDPLVHARWHEILGRDALSTRFYRGLERQVHALGDGAEGAAPAEARHALALATASRLLFLSFLEGRGWLDGDANFLARHCDMALRAGGIHRRVLEPLFFGTLNTPLARRAERALAFGRVPFLNGGLFTRSPLEQRFRALRFRDTEVAALFDEVLTRYRFTAFEDRGEASEAAIDPEMLGRAFESLMASRDRRETGAFYTPHALVERTTEAALGEFFLAHGIPGPLTDRVLAGQASREEGNAIRPLLRRLRVLDPACGSGAFLVHVLDRLVELQATTGDGTPRALLKRRVLTQSIFGVDVNPMAVWLCELRLWLSTLVDLEVDDPRLLPPLPNLDRNVRVGDALDGGAWESSPRGMSTIARDRERYARSTGTRKALLARRLDMAERRAAVEVIESRLASIAEQRWSLVTASRGRDLFGGRRGSLPEERARRVELQGTARRLRRQREALRTGGALPFRFASHFADAVRDGGFDLVVGNPPWVRIHRIPPERREQFRATFRVFRDAAWAGAASRGATFGAQVDLAALFAEQSLRLLRPGGILAMLLPMKLWRSVAGGGVRSLLHGANEVRVVEDWSDAPAAFDAAAYPSLVVVRKTPPAPADPIRITVHRQRLAVTWSSPREQLGFDESRGSPWITLPPDAQRAFRRLATLGAPLSQWQSPMLGIKCGCNDAFLVSDPREEGGATIVTTARGNVRLERDLLRPILRGEQVRAWIPRPSNEWVVWTHGPDGRPLKDLPDATRRWLGRWRPTLSARSDVRGTACWWSLFRIEGAVNERPRVVWADMSRGPRALILPARSPMVPLNTCYVLPCRDDTDASALATLLNTPLVAAWLAAIAEPARGGYQRFLAWTVAALPLPANWARAREVLAPLGTRAVAGNVPSETDLLAAACDAYRVSLRSVGPLVEWLWR